MQDYIQELLAEGHSEDTIVHMIAEGNDDLTVDQAYDLLNQFFQN